MTRRIGPLLWSLGWLSCTLCCEPAAADADAGQSPTSAPAQAAPQTEAAPPPWPAQAQAQVHVEAMARVQANADAEAASQAAPRPLDHQVLVMLDLPPAHFRADGSYGSAYSGAPGSAARRRTALALAAGHGLRLLDAWPMPALGVDCFLMAVPADHDLQRVSDDLGHDARVAWAQPVNGFRGLGHDDPLYPMQPAAARWHLDALHDVATGRDVRVAVIDSGVQDDHPDLKGQVALHEDFALAHPATGGERHGTAVAGIIAAIADNHLGTVGVAPHARLLALRACWQLSSGDTACDSFSLARALQSAIDERAQVINLSLGGPNDRLLRSLIQAALARRIAVVAAVDPLTGRDSFPADVPGVVAATDDAAAAGPPGMVAAPGKDVPTTLPVSRWATVSGSSYAAAHVSGLLAIMLEARMRRGDDALPGAAVLVRGSDGQVDACASVGRMGALAACAPALAPMARVDTR